jgi:RluA family pseudouridine synthase
MQEKFYIWTVSKKDANKKLLGFLKEKLNCSNKQIKKILEKGLCLVNDKIERFGSISLRYNFKIKLHSSWEKILDRKKINKVIILYEDQDFLAIDKPLNFISSDQNIHNFFSKKYHLIHRLDKDTTGVLLIAKTEKFKIQMIQLFKKNEVIKKYIAIIDGTLNQKNLKIESFIKKIKSFDGQTIYGSSKEGKYALTYLEVLKKYKDRTLVELQPITGRTHQLRVHMKRISHPILGDFLYSKKFYCKEYVSRLMLHCYQIEFEHPITHENITIISEIPGDFNF